MKNEKGITLMSLTIYIIVMLIVVAIVSTISLFFYNNVLNVDDNSQNLAEFNKFNAYFLDDAKKAGNSVVSAMGESSNQIKFSDGAIYKYVEADKAIYKGTSKVCDNVAECAFKTELIDGKEVITVDISIGNTSEFKQKIDYVVESSSAGAIETKEIGTYDSDTYDSKIEQAQSTNFVFTPNGNVKYKNILSTKISISEGTTKIKRDTLKYLIKNENTRPNEGDFESSFEDGDDIEVENLNGTYYVWAYGKDEKNNTIMQGSDAFKLDNTAPEITRLNALIGETVTVDTSSPRIPVNERVPGGSNIEIEVTGSDNSELAEIVYYIKEGNGDYPSQSAGTTKISGVSVTKIKNQQELTIPLADGTYSIKIELKDEAENSSYIELTNIIVQTITEANYKVEHYKQKVDGTYELAETEENLEGTIGQTETATPKTYQGFTLDTNVIGTIQSGTVTADGNLVLRLYYTRGTYTVTFNVGENATVSPSSINATYGSTYGDLPVPTKTGHTFNGWYTQQNGEGTKVESTTIANIIGDQTLYAKWTANEYTITLNNQSATNEGTPSIYETYGNKYSLSSGGTAMTTKTNEITVPTRTGYAFGGYYTERNGEGTQIIDANGFITSGASTTQFDRDSTIYAKWTDATNPIIELSKETSQDGFEDWELSGGAYIENGTLHLPDSDSTAKSRYYSAEEPWYLTYDSYAEAPNSESLGGSYFSTKYYNSELTNITNNAGAESNEWGKTFELNEWNSLDFSEDTAGNSNVYGGNIKYITIEFKENSAFSKKPQRIKNLKVHGQLWSGFYDIKINATDNESGVKKVKYAVGERNTEYFATNGTEVTGDTIRVTENGTYTLYAEDNSGNKTVQTIVINQIDITAPTNTAPTYTKTANSITVTNRQVDNESGIFKVEYAIKESGKEYGAWQSSNVFTGLRSSTTYNIKTRTINKANLKTVSEEETVTTDTIEYTITLDDQEATTHGTGTIYEIYENNYSSSNNGLSVMTTSTNAINVPTKTGYAFGGYYTRQNGEGIQVIDANGYITSGASNTLFTEDSTIYANWLEGSYIVTFNATGGEVSEATRPVPYDTALGELPPDPQYVNHIFDNWYTGENGTGTKVTASTIVNGNVTYYAKWIDAIAEVNGKYYTSLAKAIESITTSDETTVRLVNDTNEKVTINSGRNIIFDFENCTLSSIKGNNNTDVIENKGNLTIISGTITSSSGQGAINNNTSNSVLKITGGSIIATGSRQAVYNDKGRVEISGGYFSAKAEVASNNKRGTVHNNSGTMIITGGIIESTTGIAVTNKSTMTIGTKDGQLNRTSPVITGKVNGLNNESKFNFYDGNIRGETSALSSYDSNKIGDMESGYGVNHEKVGEYDHVTFVVSHIVTFNPNGGNLGNDLKKRTIQEGNQLGELPTPTQAGNEFIGWFDSATGGTEVTAETLMGTDDITYYAHWLKVAPAEVDGKIYGTIQEAINKNSSGVEIDMIANATEHLTISSGKNVTINLNGYSISNNGNEGIIENNGSLTITNGNLDAKIASKSAIDNNPGCTLVLDGVKIIATGKDDSTENRQTVYNKGGTVTIKGDTYLESKASGSTNNISRGTIHNLEGGTVTIESGTIVNIFTANPNTANAAISNDATSTVIIGTKDGLYNPDDITIIGKKYGIYNAGTLKYYDGTINGILGAVSGTTFTEVEDYHDQENDTKDIQLEDEEESTTYQRLYLLRPITIIPSTLDETSAPITATIIYNSQIVSGMKAGFGPTLEEAIANASELTANSVTITGNGYVYAEGVKSNEEPETKNIKITYII